MPHLRLECAPGLEGRVDLSELCARLHGAMVQSGIFPLGGIRVRAHVCDAAAVGDLETANGFVAMELSVGAGRETVALQAAGQLIFDAAKAGLAEELAAPHFMLSLEIREIDPQLSWKANTVHARLRGGQ